MSKEIYKPKAVSGFPEWLPGFRRLEQQWLDHIRRVFESYGYTNIETPAVEDVNVLQAKGEIAKEIYGLHRLNAEPGEERETRLALHFDLTVPMARYVAQNFNDLDFPFKRYAMQKVWRGERPQKGRMREFYQCDIDVIGVDNLPLSFDAEMPAVIHEAFQGLGIGRTQIRISNRKILIGLFQGKIDDAVPAIQALDKIEKIGAPNVETELRALGLDEETVKTATAMTGLLFHNGETVRFAAELNAKNDMMREGFKELAEVMDNLAHLPEGAIVADLSISRGLDYYTGTVYETRLLDVPEFTGSVCSGGRYDDLAGRFISKHLPGVGISIGLSRLFDVLMQSGKLTPLAPSPTQILVALWSEETRALSLETAATLRTRGYNVEVYHVPQKIGKQIGYAEKKGISFVWFPPSEEGGEHEIKNMKTGAQSKADASGFNG